MDRRHRQYAPRDLLFCVLRQFWWVMVLVPSRLPDNNVRETLNINSCGWSTGWGSLALYKYDKQFTNGRKHLFASSCQLPCPHPFPCG